MNNVALAGTLITSPAVAFAELRERPQFWFPLLLMVLSSVALMTWYYSVVDVPWLVDRMMAAYDNTNMSDADRARMAGALSRNTMLISSVVSIALVIPLACAAQAVYFLLAGKVAGIERSFRQWFSMTAWTNLPAVVLTLASSAVLLTESTPVQISPTELQVLSLNQLFFQIPMGKPGATLLDTLTLIAPWTWALTIICIREWTARSWAFSATFALLPSVLFYGGWALIAFW